MASEGEEGAGERKRKIKQMNIFDSIVIHFC